MEKIKEFMRETNGLAIFSFLLAIFAWFYSAFSNECSDVPPFLSEAAALIGIFALIWLKRRKQKGGFLAVSGIFLGIVGMFLLITMC